MNPSFDSEIQSPNEMLVDPQEYVVADLDNEKDDIAIINPDDPARIRADNYDAMIEVVLPPLQEQPPIIETVHNTWEIEGWRSMSRKEHGPVFQAGGHPWRILMFPFGNNADNASFYLETGYENNKPPDDFVCCVQFALVLWNKHDPTLRVEHTAHHRFTKDEGDWGFTRFMEIRKLFQLPWAGSDRPLVENDEANMTAYVRVVKDETGVLWHTFTNYDSKKETGFVGLRNQGATCYLNSLIQSLYFTNAFRKAVYQIPTQDEDTSTNSAYTLQRLFYQLQSSSTAVSTSELTKSFGWETRHIFEQQDVQELSRKLMEKMETKMKGTGAENVLPRLFCGKVRTYISCINVDYESRRVEDFWDIQLNVSGNKNIEESFMDYIQVETMDGENQYFAGEEHKLQDARKGVIFESFPEVLHLQLKRFQYDIDRDAMMKINDRYEFPETFDAAPYLSEDADKSESWVYQLHGVLVHSGDLNAGHYYAFIKPEKDGWFYKYDDDKVTKATMREVLEDNYGGEISINGHTAAPNAKPTIRHNSAYMLVYIRQARLDEVLCPVTTADTPSHLQRKLEEEAAFREARRKEREEQHLYLTVRAITEDTFHAHGGIDLTIFDQIHDLDPAAARSYRLLRKSTIKQLTEKIAEDVSIDPKLLRLWCMVNRQNKTTRPDQPILDENQTIEDAHLKLAGSKTQELRLWAETAQELDPQGEPLWPTYQSPTGTPVKTDLIVLFLKWFDVESQALVGCSHVYISKEKKVEDLAPIIVSRMGWPEKTQLKLFEEIKPDMIEPMKAKQTLKAAELQDGDIVCFQKVPEKELANGRADSPPGSINSQTTLVNSRALNPDHIEDARLYYDFLRHRRTIKFWCHPTKGVLDPETIEPFTLVLSSKHTYDQVAAKVAEKLEVDHTHLRFWGIATSSSSAKNIIKRTPNQTLQGMLNPTYSTFTSTTQRSDALYFEVLEMSIAELDTKKAFKVNFISDGISKEDLYEVFVPKNGTLEDLISALIKKAQLEDEEKGGRIRVFEIHNSKIHKQLPRDAPVLGVTEYIPLQAERIPEEELDESSGSQPICAYHYQGEPNKAHSIPFQFKMIQDEPFSETKKRLEKRTGFKGKKFEKIKFSVVRRSTYSKPIYLNDDDILWDVATLDDDLLGLDHVDTVQRAKNGTDLFLK